MLEVSCTVFNEGTGIKLYIELREYYFVDGSYTIAVESFTKSVITKGPSLGIWSLVTRGPTLLNTKSFLKSCMMHV